MSCFMCHRYAKGLGVKNSTHLQNRNAALWIFTKFVVQFPFGRGSVLLWRRCDTGAYLMSMNAL